VKAIVDTNVIVSGDRRLQAVTGWSGIHVATPRNFLSQYML
jgi:hypothetical protein